MNASALIAQIAQVATKTGEVIAPLLEKEKTVEAALQLGRDVVQMIDFARATFQDGGEDAARLVVVREDLEKRVNDHVEKTAARLRGK